MKTSDFYYDLPKELIAQKPVHPRDASRMMILNRRTDAIEHRHFSDIADYLNPGDCLVLNDTKVIPARIFGIKEETGARVEFLLLKDLGEKTWEVLAGPGKKAREGAVFTFGGRLMRAQVKSVLDNGNRVVKFDYKTPSIYETLDIIGEMPLPPYITEKLDDAGRYQTVYSKILGSAAAPTAGLHFTDELLSKIEAKGVKIAYVTLHVGLGTFRPVKAENIEEHKMHTEHYSIPQETADIINLTKKSGGRVVAVGTTCCRTLESACAKSGEICASSSDTGIFIYPGYEFKCIDALVTNFHLPESTLIMLVSAFYGYEKTMRAYDTAVKEKYRFFSFGDAMMIL